MHELQHERSGEAFAHRAATERAMERDQLEQAYQESLRADQEREAREAPAARQAEREEEERRAAEAAAAAAAAAREAELRARRRVEAREDRRREAAARLAPEPAVGTPGTATLRLVLPSGISVLRRFPRGAPMWQVFLWTASLPAVASLADDGGGEGGGGEGGEGGGGADGSSDGWELMPPVGLGIEGPLYPSGESIQEMQLAPECTIRIRPAL
jgi:hypothetical protein